MNRYRSPEAWVEAAWQELDTPDTGRRDGCLEVVGDMLETGRLSQDDAERRSSASAARTTGRCCRSSGGSSAITTRACAGRRRTR
ncbi:hypothetical protein [Streptomyces sp. NPDC058412]|uniref:hypothetical protein n=1 Tax=Streptomyces sp. NPDC058412 TaxID=3346486 RepID=UPI003666D8AD